MMEGEGHVTVKLTLTSSLRGPSIFGIFLLAKHKCLIVAGDAPAQPHLPSHPFLSLDTLYL